MIRAFLAIPQPNNFSVYVPVSILAGQWKENVKQIYIQQRMCASVCGHRWMFQCENFCKYVGLCERVYECLRCITLHLRGWDAKALLQLIFARVLWAGFLTQMLSHHSV